MRVTEVRFTRRYNVGQFEHEEYTVGAALEEDDSSVESLIQLKEDVAAAYGGALPEGEVEEEVTPSKKKKAGKKTAAKNEQDEEEEEESSDDESNEDEDGDEDSEEEDSENDSDSEEEEEAAPSKNAKAGKGGKKRVKKPQTYDRNEETHKEIFSNVLKTVAPDWKKTEASKKKAKSASAKMEGKNFLDEDGEVIPAFKTAVKKLMGK